MPARNPEDLDRLFSEALNAGDIDALTKLYEPQAALRPSPDQGVHGHAAIRSALAGFLGMKPTITMTIKTLGQAGDLALTTSNWKLTGTGPDGNPVAMTGQGVEVARRQSDGTWLYAIDIPWGLGWGA
jgi:ketosteroid isomerase-like protein